MIKPVTLNSILLESRETSFNLNMVQSTSNLDKIKEKVKIISKEYEFELPEKEFYLVLYKNKPKNNLRLFSPSFEDYLFSQNQIILPQIEYWVSLIEKKTVVVIYDDNFYRMRKLELFENGKRIKQSDYVNSSRLNTEKIQIENEINFDALKREEDEIWKKSKAFYNL